MYLAMCGWLSRERTALAWRLTTGVFGVRLFGRCGRIAGWVALVEDDDAGEIGEQDRDLVRQFLVPKLVSRAMRS